METARKIRILTVAFLFVAIHIVRNFKEEFYFTSSHDLKNGVGQSKSSIPISDKPVIRQTNQEPFVLLHVGPHKTGTTSMQNVLLEAAANEKSFLKVDNINVPMIEELPGTFHEMPLLNFAHCQISNWVKEGGQMSADRCNKLRKVFKPYVQKSYEQSKNIVIIAEDLDRLEIDLERIKYYLEPYTRIRVVATYRRLHDWLPSFYNQIVDLYMGEYAGGNERYPSVVEWLETKYENFIKVHAINLANRYQKIAESVQLMNMHEKIDLIENFFCNYVPDATATCQAIKDGAVTKSITNVGNDHERERIVVMASLQGKLPFPLSKPDTRQIAKHLWKQIKMKEIPIMDVPRICPPSSFLEEMFRTEIQHETNYFMEWYESQGGEEGLRAAFDKALASKLCSMDIERILGEGILDDVFQTFQ